MSLLDRMKQTAGYQDLGTECLKDFTTKLMNVFKEKEVYPYGLERAEVNFKKVKTVIVGDLRKLTASRMATTLIGGEFYIFIDSEFYNEFPEEVRKVLLYHDLVHVGSRTFDNRIVYGNVDKNNRGFREGVSQFIAEDASGIELDDEYCTYPFAKRIAAVADLFMGDNKVYKDMICHTDYFKEDLEKTSNKNYYYTSFLRDINTLANLYQYSHHYANEFTISPTHMSNGKANLANQLYEHKKDVFLKKFTVNYIFPKFYEIAKGERQAYFDTIKDIFKESPKDIKLIYVMLQRSFSGNTSLDMVNENEKIVEKNIDTFSKIAGIMGFREAVVTQKGKVFLAGNRVTDHELEEEILAYTYFQDYSANKIEEIILSWINDPDRDELIVELPLNKTEAKKAMAAFNQIAKDNGYQLYETFERIYTGPTVFIPKKYQNVHRLIK